MQRKGYRGAPPNKSKKSGPKRMARAPAQRHVSRATSLVFGLGQASVEESLLVPSKRQYLTTAY